MKISFVTLILVIPMKMFSQNKALPNDLVSKIDKEISTASNLPADYFDNYLNSYPLSDYLIGLKAYFMCYNLNVDSAALFINNAIRTDETLNQSSFVNLALGGVEQQKGNISKAENLFKKSLELDHAKKNKWTLLELFYLYEQKDSAAAKKYLLESIEIDSCFPTALYELSIKYYSDQQFGKALESIDKCLSCSPLFVQAYNQKALTLIEFNRFEDAVSIYKKVFTLKKDDIEALLGLGYIYQYFIINHDLSSDYYYSVLKIDTENFAALKGLGLIESEKRNCTNAIKYLQKAITINDDVEISLELMYCFIAENRIEEAKVLRDKLLKMNIDDNRFYLFDILVDHFDKKSELTVEKVNIFKKTRSETDFNWLKQQLHHWNIKLIPIE